TRSFGKRGEAGREILKVWGPFGLKPKALDPTSDSPPKLTPPPPGHPSILYDNRQDLGTPLYITHPSLFITWRATSRPAQSAYTSPLPVPIGGSEIGPVGCCG